MKLKENILGDGKPENSLGYLIWQISHIRQRKINLALIDIDLTYPQFVLLSGIQWLKQNDEKVNQVQLIRFTKMDKSVVSSILKLLEKKEIIVRETDKKDTRAKVLELSNKGIDQLKQAFVKVKQIDSQFFDLSESNKAKFNTLLVEIFNMNN